MTMQETVNEAVNVLRRWHQGESHFTLTTSGSTGDPTPINHSREALEWSAESTLKTWFQWPENSESHTPISPIQLCILPLNKAGGFMQLIRSAVWNSPLWIGPASASPFQEKHNINLGVETSKNDLPFILILNGEALPFTWERWTQYKPNLLSITPMQLQLALNESFGQQILSSMHTVLIGGQAMSESLEKQLLSDFPKTRWIHTFGSTETASHFAGRILNHGTEEYTLTAGSSLTTTDSGEIQICNPATNNRKITLHDKIKQTSPTSFIWLGRTNLYINSGGVKIPVESLEMEISSLLQWPISTFYVAGKPHPLLGEELTLFTTHSNAEISSINQKLSILPKLHQPKNIIFISAVSMTENGKIVRSINP